ncbi:GIY-YIG nuclease family protein [Deinococcus sonorensis]|uniref:GIY-YIG nuclease family protein n=2 Tax=Deinococcus sonorensis TaxID=309891 RepID=A0AAU7UAD0_9DEIO
MTGTADSAVARRHFEGWLAAHQGYGFVLANAGEPMVRGRMLAQLTSLTGRQQDPEYICLLMEQRLGDETPAHIGRTRTPGRYWSDHLRGLLAAQGEYARWRRRLLREGHDTVRYDLHLYVIGQRHVAFAPQPDGPVSAEAVERQLVALATEGFPLRLLNDGDQTG